MDSRNSKSIVQEREVRRERSDRESVGTRAPPRSSNWRFRTIDWAKSETWRSHCAVERRSISSTTRPTPPSTTSASSSFSLPLLFSSLLSTENNKRWVYDFSSFLLYFMLLIKNFYVFSGRVKIHVTLVNSYTRLKLNRFFKIIIRY